METTVVGGRGRSIIFYKAVLLINWRCCQAICLRLHLQASASDGGEEFLVQVLPSSYLIHSQPISLSWAEALANVSRTHACMEDETVKKTNFPPCPSSHHGNSCTLETVARTNIGGLSLPSRTRWPRLCTPHWFANVLFPRQSLLFKDAAILASNVFQKAGLTRESV